MRRPDRGPSTHLCSTLQGVADSRRPKPGSETAQALSAQAEEAEQGRVSVSGVLQALRPLASTARRTLR